MNSKLKVPFIALSIVWIISLVGYIYTMEDDPYADYPILREDGLRCNEKWEGDKLIERNCRRPDMDLIVKVRIDDVGTIYGSGSMEPGIEKGDITYLRKVSKNEILWVGEVYIYRTNSTRTIIHRLMDSYIGEDGEEYFIFKGDNNNVLDEPVIREQIEEMVVGVCFERGRGLCT